MGKLDVLIKDFNREYKEELVTRGIPSNRAAKIPFSSPRANYMLYGGIPRGRIIEFAGEEGGGKTTTALDIAANAQRLFRSEWADEIKTLTSKTNPNKSDLARLTYLQQRGAKQIVYVDCENTLDDEWAATLGVDVNTILLLRPQTQTAEQIFEMTLQMIQTDEVGLVVIDSLGVMLSAQAYEKTMEEKTYGGIAMALTLFSKKAEMACAKYDCTLIGINQMREDMNSQYGGLTTTGGKAWKHNCSVRLMFQKGSYLGEDGEELKRSAPVIHGNQVNISVVKTKVCKPDRRTGFYTLMYGRGIDRLTDLVETALRFDLIKQSGSWFYIIDPATGEAMKIGSTEAAFQGKVNMVKALREGPEGSRFTEWLDTEISKRIAQ